ncbi:hypothetical protein HNP84_010287 [Thermocatellispora tengchongensis]|uniref:Uncharacterized protein n=1 Tax=Thermocatellispora tengchongensis TaxID=1073253 RepID=A0A840PNK8_9ACTN|nr:hypothetical protein [Thermocatellispora tengchongensis]
MTPGGCICDHVCDCSTATGEPVVVGERVVGYQDGLFTAEEPPTNPHGSPLL